ncbi:hypothetical protein ACLKMH_02110 [Psychromonas sp. KJ10-10]|uniref:hypothetical protein n=1 Tax=Psychromonas sp. KJ10-10 TaxID=3391823 RepID=UPI0039B4C13C
MRFLPLSTIAISLLLLTACGGTLEGATDDTSTDETDSTTTAVDTEVPIVESAVGSPSYFSYEGVSSDWITIKGVGAEGTRRNCHCIF